MRVAIAEGVMPCSISVTSTASRILACAGVGRVPSNWKYIISVKLSLPIRSSTRFAPRM